MLLFGMGNISLPDMINAATKAPTDYASEADAAAAAMPPLGANQKSVVVTVTDSSGVTTPYLKFGTGSDKLRVMITS